MDSYPRPDRGLFGYFLREFRPSALSFMLLAVSASAGFFGGGIVTHGHSSTADGGRITNLALLGTLSVPGTLTTSSSVTFNGGFFGPAAPVMVFASSQAFTAVSAATVTLVTSPYGFFDCDFSLVQNTAAGAHGLRFNIDATAGAYQYAGVVENPAGAAAGASNSATFIYATGVQGNTVKAARQARGTIKVAVRGAVTGVTGSSSYMNSGDNFEHSTFGGEYAGAATTLTIFAGAGTATGTIHCRRAM